MKKDQKGFTLIELLVVIAIIGLLSTLAVVSLNNARIKSRDARRVSDVKTVQTALEMYFTENNHYPTADGSDASLVLLEGDYIASVPDNPTPNGLQYTYRTCDYDGANCYNTDQSADLDNAASYTLTYTLEGGVAPLDAGAHCATPAGIDAGEATVVATCVPGTDSTTAG